MKNVYEELNRAGVTFVRYDHPAVFTNDESEKLAIGQPQENTKNLFLSDEKDQRFYLLTLQHGKRADLKAFASNIGERRLHFAGARWLQQLLGLTPGSVTPLGLINDTDLRVKFYFDEDLLKQEKIYVHPDKNTATLELAVNDFSRFIELTGHTIHSLAV